MPKKLDKARLADVIIFAAIFGDEQTLERYEISIRTLRRYRKRLDEDDELNQLVAEGVAAIKAFRGEDGQSIPNKLSTAIDSILGYMTRAAESGVTAEMLTALNESFAALSEYDLAMKLLDARVAQENTGEGEGLRPAAQATGSGRVFAEA